MRLVVTLQLSESTSDEPLWPGVSRSFQACARVTASEDPGARRMKLEAPG